MFEGLIASILNKVLGDFIENIDSNQLSISVWSGQVSLENLQIKSTLFDSMPLPFVLQYGKVGRIFIDGVTSVLTKPLIIEVSDVFMLIKPKPFDLWSEEVEMKAFRETTLKSLEKYEAYLNEKIHLEQQDPGMMQNMVTKIIDNLQLRLSNIYVRIEDDISVPRMPFALGMVIGNISAVTKGDQWQDEFIGNQDITNKEFGIKNFAVYMNFAEKKEEIMYDYITANWVGDSDSKHNKFLKQECEFVSQEKNNYIVDKFEINVRATINKNMKNLKPQVWAHCVLGGLVDPSLQPGYLEQNFIFSIQQQQSLGLLKFLEFVGNYGKFQQGVVAKIYKKEMTEQEENDYMQSYSKFKEFLKEKKQKEADQLKKVMEEKFELHHTYDKIVLLRTIATKKFEFETMRRNKLEQVQTKVKQFEESKQSALGSVVSIFGFGKSQEQKKQEEEQLKIYEEQLQREQESMIQEEKEKLQLEIAQLKSLKKLDEDSEAVADLIGTDYVQFDIKLTIPCVKLSIRREDNKKVTSFKMEKLSLHCFKGFDFMRVHFTIHYMELSADITQSQLYPNLMETKLPLKQVMAKKMFGSSQLSALNMITQQQNSFNAITMFFEMDPRKHTNCPYLLEFKSDAQFFIFANFDCLREIQDVTAKMSDSDASMLDYYADVARKQIFEYVYEGSEIILSQNEVVEVSDAEMKKNRASIIMDIQMSAPVIFVPEDYYRVENNSVLVIDMGNIKIDSQIVQFSENIDYLVEINPTKIYDSYNFELKGFQVLTFEKMGDYKQYKTSKSCTLIRDVTFKIQYYQNLEPNHQIMPQTEINITLESMNVMMSDYLIQFFLRLQRIVTEKLTPRQVATKQPLKMVKGKSSKHLNKGDGLQMSKGDLDDVEDEDEEDFQSCQSEELVEDMIEEVDEAEVRRREMREKIDKQLPTNANLTMIQRMKTKQKEELIEFQKQNIQTMNVLIAINKFEFELMEAFSDDNHHDESINMNIENTSKPHRELMKFEVNELVLNYNVKKDGIQRTSVILGQFSLLDVKTKDDEQFEQLVPFQNSHIISNPDYVKAFRNLEEEDEIKIDINVNLVDGDKNYNSSPYQKPSQKNSPLNDATPKSKRSNYLRPNLSIRQTSRQYSYMTMDQEFYSCASQAEFSELVKRELQTDYQAYIIMESDPFQNTSKIDFVFSNLRIVVSLATFEYLMKFQNQIFDIMEEENKKTLLQEKKQKYEEQSKSSSDEGTLAINAFGSPQFINDYQTKIQERKLDKKGVHDYQLLTNFKTSQLKFKANFKNISLWIPLDSLDDNSRVLEMSLTSQIQYQKDALQVDFINSVTNDVMVTREVSSREDSILTLNKLSISMVNRHLEREEGEEPSIERLLQPSRMTVKYKNIIENHGLKSDFLLDVLLEPFELKIGYREISFFNQLNQRFIDFQQNTAPVEKKIEINPNLDLDKVMEQQIKQQLEKEIEKTIERSNRVKIRKEDQIGIQTIKFKCETFRFSLMDDTGLNEYPVIFLNVSQINFNNRVYEDIDNAAVFFLKKIGVLKKKDKTEEPYLTLAATMNVEIFYFNQNVQAYEPFLESWNIKYVDYQEEKYLPKISQVISNDMMNINCTYALMQVVTNIQNKLVQKEEDWEDENWIDQTNSFKVSEMSKKSARQSTHNTQREQQYEGFLFSNKLNVPLQFSIEGTSVHEMKSKLFTGLVGNIAANVRELEGLTLQQAIDKVDKNDPKAHYKQLAQIVKFNLLKKQEEEKFEKITRLEAKGPEAMKFRKADELHYLMKTINRGKAGSTDTMTYEEEILKIDLNIDGYKLIRGIPIELGGVRSFYLEPKIQPNRDRSSLQEKPSKIAILSRVHFSQLKKEVEFQSTLLLSNNSRYPIVFCTSRSTQQMLNKSQIRSNEIMKLEPNNVFQVPLTWFIKNKSIYAQHLDGNFSLLIPSIAQTFEPDKPSYDIKPCFVQIMEDDYIKYCGVNITYFKCKPTTLNLPGQFLITFCPAICVNNYLFNNLEMRIQKNNFHLEAERGKYFYCNLIKIDPEEQKSQEMVKWTFDNGDTQSKYESEYVPLFTKFTQKNKKIPELPYNAIKFKLKSSNSEENLDTKEIAVKCELSPFNLLKTEYENFELRDKIFDLTASHCLTIYAQTMIVNQAKILFQIKTQGTDQKETLYEINEGQNDFFFTSNDKAQLKTQNYQWSKQFDTSTIGLNGISELKLEPTCQLKNNAKIRVVGVVIENGVTPFHRTKIIKIVPRFIVINNLDIPLAFKQKGQTSESPSSFLLQSGEKEVFHFQNKEKDAFMQLRTLYKEEQESMNYNYELLTENRIWSSPFSIEDLEDFQVSCPQNDQMQTYDESQNLAWYLPQKKNQNQRFVRVSITTQDDASIFIIFNNPKFPEYYIQNKTDEAFYFKQDKSDKELERRLEPFSKIPFVWDDETLAVKKLSIRHETNNSYKSYPIDKVKVFNKNKIEAQKDVFTIEVLTIGDTRTVEIQSKKLHLKKLDTLKKRSNKGSSALARALLNKMLKTGLKLTVELKGLGISIVDNEPKELIYISLYKFYYLQEIWKERKQRVQGDPESDTYQEQITNMQIEIGHFQIDNVINEVMPVLFSPTQELVKNEKTMEELKNDDPDYTPFIQIKIEQSEINDGDIQITKFNAYQFAIQEMKLEVETGLVNALLKFQEQIFAAMSDQQQYLSGHSYKQAKTRYQKLNRQSTKLQNLAREEVCSNLIGTLPESPDMSIINQRKVYYEFVNFGALKIKITLKFERKAFEFNTAGFGNIFYTIFTTVATISESPITFKEIILMHSFTSQQNLNAMITRNYVRQGMLQFYKLIGSSDLLGNPVGLIDKLGTGVFEFFNEPRKGLMKGPKEFVGGIGKGVKSLVSNIVSGSFDSVSKITGSLYGVVKNVSGDTQVEQTLKKPEGAFDGIYLGLKGGASEIASGLTGIFTKPYQRAKQEGAKGFAKGLGTGLLGAVASPFAATLRIGNTVSTGIKNSAIKLGKGKIPIYGRFRHPRYFNSKNILLSYDEGFSEASAVMKRIENGKYAGQTIRFFALCELKKDKGYSMGILLITDIYVMFIEEFKKIVFISPLNQIIDCEVYGSTQAKNKTRIQKGDEHYFIIIKSKKRGVLKLKQDAYGIFDKVYSILTA